jgi:hypothetical protein
MGFQSSKGCNVKDQGLRLQNMEHRGLLVKNIDQGPYCNYFLLKQGLEHKTNNLSERKHDCGLMKGKDEGSLAKEPQLTGIWVG